MKIRRIVAGLLASFQLTSLINVGVQAEGSYGIDVNFGEKLTLQETEGYKELPAGNALEVFNAAQAELPTEVPVLNKFEVKGTNKFYVAANAHNGNGTESSPFSSISEALDAVKALSDADKANGTVIYLAGGEYDALEVMNITDEHSSDDGALFIASKPGQRAVITGKKHYGLSKAQSVNSGNTEMSVMRRMNKSAYGKLYYIDYADIGMDSIPYGTLFKFSRNGVSQDMRVARYPNNGTNTINEVIKDGSYIDTNDDNLTKTGRPMEWIPDDQRPFSWNNANEIHLVGRIANEWTITDGVIQVDKISNTIKSTDGVLAPNHSPITTQFWNSIAVTFYYTNIFEELDAPGEYYADDKTKRLYFYPPSGKVEIDDEISYGTSDGYVFNVTNGKNIVFSDIKISNTENAIKIDNGYQVVIQNSELSDLTSIAVSIVNSTKCGLLNSAIHTIKPISGSVASISITDDAELVARRNFVQNSSIYDVPQGIAVGATGTIISHNLFQNTGYNGIGLSGQECIIEYNEFSGVANKITDAGGIYVGGNILTRCNTIRYNYFHDSKPDKKNARAIYNDDCSDMSWNYGNIIKNYGYGLFQHSGDDHVIKDNVVIEAGTYIRNSHDYSANEKLMINYFFKEKDVGFIRNHVFTDEVKNSVAWNTRYKNSVFPKYDQIMAAREVYRADENMFDKTQIWLSRYTNGIAEMETWSEEEKAKVKQVCDVIVDSGCYYIDNTLGSKTTIANGYGPSYYALRAAGYYEPENVMMLNGNIVTNSDQAYNKLTFADDEEIEAYIDDYIQNNIPTLGLINGDSIEQTKPIILQNNGAEIQKSDFDGLSWTGVSYADRYTVEIATDSAFTNIVASSTMSEKSYPTYKYTLDKDSSGNIVGDNKRVYNYELETDTTYYARVKAKSAAKTMSSTESVSDAVSFVLRESIDYDSAMKEALNADTYVGDKSNYLRVSGSVPSHLLAEMDKQVTILLYEGEEPALENVKHIYQLTADKNNKFSCDFPLPDYTNDMKIRVRSAVGDIKETDYKASVISIDEIKLRITNGAIAPGEIISAELVVNNVFNYADDAVLFVAAYDDNNKLINAKSSETKASADVDTYKILSDYTVPSETSYIKLFAWGKTDMRSLDDAKKFDKQ